MKKKFFLLIAFLFLILLTSGCAKVEYNLEIDEDLSVLETVDISATKEYFSSFYMNLPITIVKEAYENEEQIKPLKDNNYKYELLDKDKTYPSVLASRKFSSIKDFTENTVFKSIKFNNYNTTINDNIVKLTIDDLVNQPPEDSGEFDNYYISDLVVKIKLPYLVKSSNADSVDKKNNIYKWFFTNNNDKNNIVIEFDKNKSYINKTMLYISIIVLIIYIITLVYLIWKINSKHRTNNKT